MQQLLQQQPVVGRDLCATIEYTPRKVSLPLYVIDHPDTQLHDDAVGWINTGDGFRVYTAITAAGLKTRFVTKHLPDSYTLALKKKDRKKASLGGVNQAITLSYWTDGTQIQDPKIGFGEILSRRYTHQNLPGKLKDELFMITNQPRSEASIEFFMSNYNTILAHTAAKIGVSIPYHTTRNRRHVYTAEPTPHKHLGTIYTRSTSPLRSGIDLVANLQIAKLVSGKGTPRNRKTIESYLEFRKQQAA